MLTRNLLLLFLCVTTCAACNSLPELKKKFREEGGMLIYPIAPHTNQYFLQGGFSITLQPDLAVKLNAPNGEEFLKALDDRLQKDELVMGYKYCQYGYKLGSMMWYRDWYATLAGICLADPEKEHAAALKELQIASEIANAEPPKLVKTNCAACHALDTKVVGPSWRDIANRYKEATKYGLSYQDNSLVDRLVRTVSHGGGGQWGNLPMPGIDPSDSRNTEIIEAVKYVLSIAYASGLHKADH